jgi:hypothetical protein
MSQYQIIHRRVEARRLEEWKRKQVISEQAAHAELMRKTQADVVKYLQEEMRMKRGQEKPTDVFLGLTVRPLISLEEQMLDKE